MTITTLPRSPHSDLRVAAADDATAQRLADGFCPIVGHPLLVPAFPTLIAWTSPSGADHEFKVCTSCDTAWRLDPELRRIVGWNLRDGHISMCRLGSLLFYVTEWCEAKAGIPEKA